MITLAQIELATVPILREFAKELGLKNASRIKKDELQAKLIEIVKASQPVLEVAEITEVAEVVTEEIELAEEIEQAPALKFFNRVRVMTDIAQVEQACAELAEKLGLAAITPKSRTNKLQSYVKLFKTLQPTPETFNLFFAYRAKGKAETVQRHLFFKFMGLEDIGEQINQDIANRKGSDTSTKDELAEALEEQDKVFSLDLYTQAATTLLNSNHIWHLASGLLAVSGRRPSEIVLLSEFSECTDFVPSYLKNPEYAVKIKGLAKKREKIVETYTSLLIPTKEFLDRLKYFRSFPEIKECRELSEKLLTSGYDKEASWKMIEDKVGRFIREATDTYFNFLPKINDEGRTNILLRACSIKLITLRDLPKATSKAAITYAGVLAGHVVPIFKENGGVDYNGETSASTLHYDDYRPDSSDVPFLTNVIKLEEKEMSKVADLEQIIADLQAQLLAKDVEIEALKKKIPSAKPPAEEMTNEQLFSTRKPGSTLEKISRCYQALTAYNDNEPEDRLNPTSKIISEMSGCNRKVVSDWLEAHNDEVVSHTGKYGMSEYYNNRYRHHRNGVTTETLIEKITREFLS